jgi:isopentenyl-diphosphate delta-isomerase
MDISTSEVILVNARDEATGTMEKMAAHRQGLLHRAFSVFVFNNRHELLLQQRADDKYHSGGLWSNTCCSHPLPNETTIAAAHRRLGEELGFDCPLTHKFAFMYTAQVGNGFTEHEYDHVFTGRYNGPVLPNPVEVKDHKYISIQELLKDMQASPHVYTAWLHLAMPAILKHQ